MATQHRAMELSGYGGTSDWWACVCVPASVCTCTRVIVLCACVYVSVSLLVSQSSRASQSDSGYHVKIAETQRLQAAFVVKIVTVIWHLESVCVFDYPNFKLQLIKYSIYNKNSPGYSSLFSEIKPYNYKSIIPTRSSYDTLWKRLHVFCFSVRRRT